jgi:bile acid:Na+ symporter, BASS family
MPRRLLTGASGWLLPLAALASVAALVAPSGALARRSDLVLAALVLSTALGISPAQFAGLRRRKAEVAALVLAPFAVLAPAAWLIGRLFSGALRDGVLALGASSTEIAAVGLIALAGGSAALALGALAGSLVISVLAGSVVLGSLGGTGSDVTVAALVARFALVALLPLALGLAVRARVTGLARAGGELQGLSALAVVVLVYAAMSGTNGAAELPAAVGAAALFLAVSALPVAAWIALAPAELRATGALVVGLRDFAVAAALAAQAFGPAAATVSGIYGVLMLLVGAAAAHASGTPGVRSLRHGGGRSPRR